MPQFPLKQSMDSIKIKHIGELGGLVSRNPSAALRRFRQKRNDSLDGASLLVDVGTSSIRLGVADGDLHDNIWKKNPACISVTGSPPKLRLKPFVLVSAAT